MKKIDYLIAESFITGSLLIFLLIILNPLNEDGNDCKYKA